MFSEILLQKYVSRLQTKIDKLEKKMKQIEKEKIKLEQIIVDNFHENKIQNEEEKKIEQDDQTNDGPTGTDGEDKELQ